MGMRSRVAVPPKRERAILLRERNSAGASPEPEMRVIEFRSARVRSVPCRKTVWE